MPFMCSSQRLASSLTGGSLESISLPPRRRELYARPDRRRARWLLKAPTGSEIDMSLSLRITSRSAPAVPALLSASNAIPALIAPSPITATTERSSPLHRAAIAMPSAAEIDVDEWAVPKVSYTLSDRRGKPDGPSAIRSRLIASRRPVRILWA